ncbi:MAG: flagellar hook-associated protein 3 [bacterium]|nr:flagellar hook-associated protein 3 [bacterium]
MSGWGSIHDNMMTGLRTHAQRLANLQEQVASGSAVIRASDDPSKSHRIMALHSQYQSLEVYEGNIDRVVGNLEHTDTALQQMSGLLVEAKTLLGQAGSETYSQTNRATNAEAINQLISQAVWLANSEVLGQRLFSGDDTGTQPFTTTTTSAGKITSVDYVGSANSSGVPVAPGVEQPGVMVGSEIFGPNNRQAPVLYGSTGAAAGAATSTVKGDVWLTVTHNATTFAGATGVAAGTDSAANDTIVGTAHTLTIDADNDQVKLDGGEYVSYGIGGDDANIMVTNADGDVAYVDVTSLAGGLTGETTVGITATAKLSIDDLTSTVDVTTFGANEAITDPATGKILYVDTTNLARVGVEPVSVPGTSDIFNILISVRDLLNNDRGITRQQQTQLINGSAVDAIDEVISKLTTHTTEVGGRLQAVSALEGSVANIKSSVEMRRSELQDADIVQLATDLARTQTFYEMVLASSAKVLSVSLLDFL